MSNLCIKHPGMGALQSTQERGNVKPLQKEASQITNAGRVLQSCQGLHKAPIYRGLRKALRGSWNSIQRGFCKAPIQKRLCKASSLGTLWSLLPRVLFKAPYWWCPFLRCFVHKLFIYIQGQSSFQLSDWYLSLCKISCVTNVKLITRPF